MTYAREAARKVVWANTKRDPGRGDLALERIIEDAINAAIERCAVEATKGACDPPGSCTHNRCATRGGAALDIRALAVTPAPSPTTAKETT